jgi:hypothetical protein
MRYLSKVTVAGVPTRYFFIIIISLLRFPVSSQLQTADEWLTHFEKSGNLETPRYAETIEYFRKLDRFSPYANLISFGVSPQGRELHCMVVSNDEAFSPADVRRSGRPVILIVNGIHSGEIEGKDASMLLLREILVTKEKLSLLDNVILLVVPVFSVDGHERFGPYNRINQNGPKEMGWRTTAQNLNLNRDWMKADAPEMQAMLTLISTWSPDFIIDTHSTNGADYQYTLTYILETHGNIYGRTAAWIKEKLVPYMENYIGDAGYLAYPYVMMRDWNAGIESGLTGGASTPRFSSGYAAIQNRPAIVVETLMLKPYKDRVYSTKATIESILTYANQNPTELIDLNREADMMSISKYAIQKRYFPLSYRLTDSYETKSFKGIDTRRVRSEISGGEVLVYTGEKVDKEVRFYNDVIVDDSIRAPQAYLIPVEWKGIVDRIRLHGIGVFELTEEETLHVNRYRFTDVRYAPQSYEGRQRVDVEYESFSETISIPAGTFIIPTDQRGIRVILHLLEPKAPDSFLRWGFFNTVFERKEYFEAYVMEPIARKMMAEDPLLKVEFERMIREDEQFANNPFARLNFFYERSPYYDQQHNVYPVMRVD